MDSHLQAVTPTAGHAAYVRAPQVGASRVVRLIIVPSAHAMSRL